MQRTLFEDLAPWEADDAGDLSVATVVFPSGPTEPFDYAVPDRLRGSVEIGRRVSVPLGKGNRPIIGYCVGLETRTVGSRRLKEIQSVVDQRSLLSPAMLRLTSWIAERYLCTWGQVLETVLPAGVRGQAGTRETTFLSVSREVAAKFNQLDLPKKQIAVLRYLADCPEPLTATQLAAAAHCTVGPINVLRGKGLIESHTKRQLRGSYDEPPAAREAHLTLNPDQRRGLDAVLAALNAPRYETILLHGITGSGKTEVYIQAIQEVVRFRRQAIVLVPEISLTPQTQQRFRARFGQVAVLHSHLSDAERHWHWQRIAAGEVNVVVGARSAVFAPTPQLGLIVLDEEHESSFKQDSAPRYHARDVALERARMEGVPLVLGSATPSLESWQRSEEGLYRRIELPRRVLDRPLPSVATIDLRDESQGRPSPGAISRKLQMAMSQALEADGQVILLLNRRGYSTHIQCPACGEVVKCPSCDIALVHHRTDQIALCHYCDHQIPPPPKCPACEFAGIRYGGLGTQRLEAEIRSRFPDHACLRMDTDTMQGPGSHERALDAFRAGEVRILLGTQMIAKGLDFPNVTLVGVVNADIGLHMPDFRAAERTFQLLVQVAGRTGRGEKGGRVLIQTLNPEHRAIVAAIRHDYPAFAREELPMRSALAYPPFASLVRIIVRGTSPEITNQFAAQMAEEIRTALGSNAAAARVLGPAPAPMSKLRGKHRFQIQVHAADAAILRTAVRDATARLKAPDEVEWQADVDPLDML